MQYRFGLKKLKEKTRAEAYLKSKFALTPLKAIPAIPEEVVPVGCIWGSKIIPIAAICDFWFSPKAIAAKNCDTWFVVSSESPNIYYLNLYRTRDRGSTWEKIEIEDDCEYYGKIEYKNGKLYVMYYDQNASEFSNNFLAVSEDDGDTWDYISCSYGASLYDFVVADDGTIYTFFIDLIGNLEFKKSINGGQTWTSNVTIDTGVDRDEIQAKIDGSTIYLLYSTENTSPVNQIKIAKSTDGTTWIIKNLYNFVGQECQSAVLLGLSFDVFNNTIMLAFWSLLNDNTYACFSKDGGETWTLKLLYEFDFVAEQHTCVINRKRPNEWYVFWHRTSSPETLERAVSNDYGSTWGISTIAEHYLNSWLQISSIGYQGNYAVLVDLALNGNPDCLYLITGP